MFTVIFMSKTMFTVIMSEIEKLRINASETEADCLNCLTDQVKDIYMQLFNNPVPIHEIKNLLKGNLDCLNVLDQDTEFYENVRNIQDQIICYFS